MTTAGKVRSACAKASHNFSAPRDSKLTGVLTLLQAEGGATLAELVAATGWQPHTTRAVLSGLKKKGYLLMREKHERVSRYRIVQAADQ